MRRYALIEIQRTAIGRAKDFLIKYENQNMNDGSI